MNAKNFKGRFEGRRVLVTGHTGFKGAWLSLWLKELGAKVTGFSKEPESEPNLFRMLELDKIIDSRIGDLRDGALLHRVFAETRPEIVFHLAAQAIVRSSYDDPVETFSTNVMGTVHLLQAVREAPSVRVCQIITSDKCYENSEQGRHFLEDDPMGGRDPYSASKGCSELVVASYRKSFFPPESIQNHHVSLSSVRAGNVIGGGDWAQDRLLPDCVRALSQEEPIIVRNPRSVRPWQHVLEPLSGYLCLARHQFDVPAEFAQAWNFGPSTEKALTVREVAETAVACWGTGSWTTAGKTDEPHEAMILNLDCGKAHRRLGWRPVFSAEKGIAETVQWYREAHVKQDFDAAGYSLDQIRAYTRSAADKGLSWAVSA